MIRVRFVLAVVAIGSIALTPPPAVAGIPPGRVAIGDSVMLGAKDELVARGFRVNATVSRQFRDVVPLLEQMKSARRLRRKVIIHLGNNGILIDAADCNRISEIAGPNRTVSLVNLKIPRWYRSVQNRRLAACAGRRANTVLINWFFFSRDHPFWFAADGFHLSPTGQARYAAFVATKTA
jgi:lysophospholipase L1-like esterase